jgi:hypothetical protein
MKCWEIIGDDISKAGWSCGCVSAVDSKGRTIWIVDAHRDNGKRFVARSDEKLTAFLELERIRARIIALPKCRMIGHNSPMTPLLSGSPQVSKRIRRKNSIHISLDGSPHRYRRNLRGSPARLGGILLLHRRRRLLPARFGIFRKSPSAVAFDSMSAVVLRNQALRVADADDRPRRSSDGRIAVLHCGDYSFLSSMMQPRKPSNQAMQRIATCPYA